MKKKLDKIVQIHESDETLGRKSRSLLFATALATGGGIVLAVLYVINDFHSVVLAIAVALILSGLICFAVWKKKVWNTFAHHLSELS